MGDEHAPRRATPPASHRPWCATCGRRGPPEHTLPTHVSERESDLPVNDPARRQDQRQQALPSSCSYCGRPFAPDEDSVVVMRQGTPVAAYHERCHPHHRRRGCSGC